MKYMTITMKMFIVVSTLLGIIMGISCSVIALPEQDKGNQPECWTEDQHLPHETKCNLYYRCVYGRKIVKICPTNKLFNIKIGNCDDNYNVQCGVLEVDLEEGENQFLVNTLDGKYDLKSYGDEYINWNKKGFDHLSENDPRTVVTYMDSDISTPPSECPEVTDPYEDAKLLPHKQKCNAFYKCNNGNKFVMSCPGILQFNPKIFVCDWPINVKCVERVQLTSSTTEPPSSISSNICPQSGCQDSTMYLPHPVDRKQYIRCENGKEIAEECPNDLLFDPYIHTCNYPA